MKIIVYAVALTAALSLRGATQPYLAVVTSPVADLLFQPMSQLKQNYKKGYSYERIPIGGSPHACPRAHQLRANDLVKVIEEMDDEVKVRVPSFFYLRQDNTIPQQNYWMRKKDLTALKDLPCCTAEQVCVPSPIFIDKPIPLSVTLAQPWQEPKTHTFFSAGTRFASSGHDEESYHIFVFDPAHKRYIASSCPREQCVEAPSAQFKDRRNQMVDLIRSWIADKDEGFIPYAWGGGSIMTAIHHHRPAHEHKIQLASGEFAIYYEWPGRSHTPKTGIDCSNLILLAAQSVGIPYFCKNSYTALATLRPVTLMDPLEVGDLIWIRGHVMIVADLENNTLIEARGYEHGYGKLHEIPLSEEFKGINTYQDLIECAQSNASIDRLDKEGNVRDTVPIKLLKLM